MPDDQPMTSHVSLRIPNDLIEAFDKLAAALERPRSWVMVRALRQYLDDEGAEILEDTESLAELDRGEAARKLSKPPGLDRPTAIEKCAGDAVHSVHDPGYRVRG